MGAEDSRKMQRKLAEILIIISIELQHKWAEPRKWRKLPQALSAPCLSLILKFQNKNKNNDTKKKTKKKMTKRDTCSITNDNKMREKRSYWNCSWICGTVLKNCAWPNKNQIKTVKWVEVWKNKTKTVRNKFWKNKTKTVRNKFRTVIHFNITSEKT